ncbi:WD40 repeat domain-containing serine/threonine protein kinase [Nocardiopsis suaedae]|uniref:Serine/threonine protein kinase n=1 Tax=Nocardiopsis suaedae TaxID=3018444 RepID=A0ABT4TGE2_9ACTN|nr:serine/threonine-protein kinase [Nocardiopsis suaedae]MDA2803785.1 serine/threonine protein kinase [Nocardiopsis suaedae]
MLPVLLRSGPQEAWREVGRVEPLDPSDPERIGDYRLTHRLGEGGMGRVYLGRTTSGRLVAVKVIRSGLVQDGGFRARFAREVDAARRVGGFHTAPVVGADLDAAQPWIATAYIPGPTLFQRVRDDGPVAPPDLHALVVGLAEGLKAVHDRGLVHRDLKPGNVILGDDGPRIIDFGIARPLDAESLTTREAVFGTLPYMSPEQTNGSRVGPSSDVFSLGTVLAYAATGTNPFNGATMAETVHRLIGPPPDPGDMDPGTRALIADCWEPDPDRRPTPGAILARFEALPATAAEPAPEDGGSAASSAPDTATAVEPTAEHGGAQPQEGGAGAPARPPRRPRRARIMGTAAALTALATVVVVTVVALNADTGAEGGGPGRSPSAAATDGNEPVLTIDTGHATSVGPLAFSPDGNVLATVSLDSSVRVWDTVTGERVTVARGEDLWMSDVAFAPDGTTLAVTGYSEQGGMVMLRDTESWRVGDAMIRAPEDDYPVNGLAYSPDGSTLATTSSDRDVSVRLWDIGTGEEIRPLPGEGSESFAVEFSPDGDILATGGPQGMELWDTDTWEKRSTVGHAESVLFVVFSPDGSTVATVSGGSDSTIRLWDTATGERIASLDHEHATTSATFSPDGAVLATGTATGGDDGALHLWDTGTWEENAPPTAREGGVNTVAFSPDGGVLATGEDDGLVALWEVDQAADD